IGFPARHFRCLILGRILRMRPLTGFRARAGLLIVGALLGKGTPCEGCSPIIDDSSMGCPPPLSGLCETLRDPSKSVEQKRAAVSDALSAEAPKPGDAAGWSLASAADRVDLRDYADMIRARCSGPRTCSWTPSKDDWSRLRFGSRSERVELLGHVLREGTQT